MAQELMADVHSGTCLKITAWEGNAPWVVCTELRADDVRQFSYVMDSRSSLGPPQTIRLAR